ncbi:uncharacterized protein LOC110988710 [Acanthaster planci]|uniref:ferroxidase n=1 Tax=Acanthaster planci TaxID=133434 RepID=A0A8B7ZXA7_ACAPL|nr:uncharacterized protein LOC110988710 [Acanthaster planci]
MFTVERPGNVQCVMIGSALSSLFRRAKISRIWSRCSHRIGGHSGSYSARPAAPGLLRRVTCACGVLGHVRRPRSSCYAYPFRTDSIGQTHSSFLSGKDGVYSCTAGLCRSTDSSDGKLDALSFDTMVEDILESLLDFFEQLGDEEDVHEDFDVTYSSGVLTVKFGPNHGTYVINKQTPNKQIWLSSPTSGPKRYDFTGDDWVYSHDGVPMLHLLSEEVSRIIGKDLNIYKVIKVKGT